VSETLGGEYGIKKWGYWEQHGEHENIGNNIQNIGQSIKNMCGVTTYNMGKVRTNIRNM